ncbi:hypothetical protein DKM19_44650 [Streptosporangium sp. 'caverna']|nr:hypothetical protein DKM19_44650 [Streptosporangium sp. 'caverna']
MRLVHVVVCSVLALACVGAAGPVAPNESVPLNEPVVLKEPMRGLIDRDGPSNAAYAPVVDNFVIKVNWSDLQPVEEPGTGHGAALDTSQIDQALADPEGAGMAVRLRVYGGINAPDWAKRLGGATPIPWHSDGEVIGTIGRFWTTAYGTAYQNLQDRLAALYDDDPRLLDVVIARCTTEFAEPYIRQTGNLPENRPGLEAAGYTSAADDQCHRDEIDAHQVWQRTRSYLAFNPYQRINTTTWKGSVDSAFTEQMIDYCRASLGERCVLGNNSLDPDRPTSYHNMYAYIAAKGGPISFQTATAAKLCGGLDPCPPSAWNPTLDLALTYGAGAVELPGARTGYTSWPLAETPPHHGLTYYDGELEQNQAAQDGPGTARSVN